MTESKKMSDVETILAQKATIEKMRGLLESAQNCLHWYEDKHPEDYSEADGELHAEIDQALALTPDRSLLNEVKAKEREECAQLIESYSLAEKLARLTMANPVTHGINVTKAMADDIRNKGK